MNKKREREEETTPEKTNSKKQAKEEDDFKAFKISDPIAEKLKKQGITSLFDIQKAAFEPVYSSKNVMASALTGSGKTLSFALPLVQKCFDKGRMKHDGPIVMVIAPTRELSIQISKVFQELSSEKMKFRVATIYGGVSIEDQSNDDI
jgi:superfamily II DNA/RNA helicase